MIKITKRLISVSEASQVFRKVCSADPTSLSDDDLKKYYRKLAMQYHPDTPQGSTEQFQKVKDAYDKLLAHKSGYTLSEEDLFSMYEREQKQK